jgi:hypothetical protein
MSRLRRLLLHLVLTLPVAAITAAVCVPLFGLVEDGNTWPVLRHVAGITLGGLLLVTLPAAQALRNRPPLARIAALTALGALAGGVAPWLLDAPAKLLLPAAFCGGFGSLVWTSAAARLERHPHQAR